LAEPAGEQKKASPTFVNSHLAELNMRDISKILAVIDPTEEQQPAMHRAAWLAERLGASLELLICYYNEYLSDSRLLNARLLEEVRQDAIAAQAGVLEKLSRTLGDRNIDVSTSVVWDHPLYAGIVRHAMQCGADMVFKDTHHHSAVSRAVFTNTDWNLIRTCPQPLWLVKPRELPAKPVFIGAIDPMNEHDKPAALDDEILQLSKGLSSKVGGSVHAFHSYDPRMALTVPTANAYIPTSLPLQEIESQMHARHQRRFDELTSFYDIDEANCHLVSGLAREELPRLAEQAEASVVVMGAVARNRWKRLFIGSTAERTLEALPCDLLIIKPNWFRTPVETAAYHAA